MTIEGEINLQIKTGEPVKITVTGVSGQSVELKVGKPKGLTKEISDNELVALTVMRLVLPQIYPETTGVDDDHFQVGRQDSIGSLPLRGESDYRQALGWAGAVLQGKGWTAEKITQLLIDELPQELKAKFVVITPELGKDGQEVIKRRVRNEIIKHYPGAAAALKRKRKSKVPDW